MPKKSKTEQRMLRGEPIISIPSPYWTILGLVEDGWCELYQARNEREGKQYLNSAFDDDSPVMEKYQDYALLPPAYEAKELNRPKPMSALPVQRARATRKKAS